MKKKINRILSLFGFEIHNVSFRKKLQADLQEKQIQWLKNIGIKTIIDVGANDGGFATRIHDIYPSAKIHSFEPLEDCYQELVKNLAFLNEDQFQAFNLALGEKRGTLTFFKNDFTPSSSFLEMEALHIESFPQTCHNEGVQIKVEKLDNFKDKLSLEQPILLKIDVQGYEDKVIKGSLETLKKVDVLIIEISLVKLYKGQLLFDEMYRLLYDLGFRYQGDFGQIRSPNNGRILQIDALFIREETLHEFLEDV